MKQSTAAWRAEQLIGDLDAKTTALASALEQETAHLSAGRLRDALALDARKGELSAGYLLSLQRARANIVALTRLAPERLGALRAVQVRFHEVSERNQAVLATAKAVSEGLVKSLAAEVERAARPSVYAPRAAAPPRTAARTGRSSSPAASEKRIFFEL